MEYTFTDENFEADVLGSSVPVLVDFWAPWCGPCRVMGPIIQELSNEYNEMTLKIGKMNVDDHGKTAMTYGIMSIPTMILFKGGQPVDQIVGSMVKEDLKSRLEKSL